MRPRPTLASPLGEIVFAGQFYDYEAKYSPGGMQLIVPARISPTAERRARELALEVFAASGCQGLARVDFFVDGEEVLVNELNTMPGFTPTSVYAKLDRGGRHLLSGAGRAALPAGAASATGGWRRCGTDAQRNSDTSEMAADWCPGGRAVIHSR